MKNTNPAFIEVNPGYFVRAASITEAWLSSADKNSPAEWRFRLCTTPVGPGASFYSVSAGYKKAFTKFVEGTP